MLRTRKLVPISEFFAQSIREKKFPHKSRAILRTLDWNAYFLIDRYFNRFSTGKNVPLQAPIADQPFLILYLRDQ